MRTSKHIVIRLTAILMAACLLTGCNKHPKVPENAQAQSSAPKIFPDYTDVTVPANIAPLNFKVLDRCQEVVARVTDASGNQQTYGDGIKVQIPSDEWSEMLSNSKGKSLTVEVFAKDNDTWKSFKKFVINVASELRHL